MIKESIQKAINSQINAELYSGYLYLAMGAYFQEQGLPGFAHWMEIQAAEEFFHARRFYTYLYERSGRVTFTAIETPQTAWKNTQDVFQATLQHEEKVTSLINDLVDLAIKEKDHATNNMLQWFVAEQVEEESTAKEILDQIKLIANSGEGLYHMDKQMAARVLNPLIFQDMTGAAGA